MKMRKFLCMILAVACVFSFVNIVAFAQEDVPTDVPIEEPVEDPVEEKTSLHGIDVSHHQGAINWAKVKKAGIDFAIIRCGYGDDYEEQDDRYWEENIRGCEENGIPYGVYLYSYATSKKAVASEVAHTLRLLREVNAKPTYPIYYDLEDKTVLACGRTEIIKMANQYCSAIEAAGYDAGIYSSTHWWNTYLNDASLEQYDKWVAHWAEQCGYQGYYTLWQYTSDGKVSGISGRVDMNYRTVRKSLKDAVVQIEDPLIYPYDGAAKQPKVISVTLEDGVTVLTEGVDYIVAYNNNIYPGIGQVKILGRGEYEGVVRIPITIQKPIVLPQTQVKVKLYGADDVAITWTGQNVASATINYQVECQKNGGKWSVLAKSLKTTAYKAANLADGAKYAFRVTPYVTIGGKNYYGVAKISSAIYTLQKVKMGKVEKATKTKITLKWNNIPGESGYEIAQSTKKTKGYKVLKRVGANKKTVKLKVKSKKTYYYKVRAYKTVDGKRIYGTWSSVQKFKLK